jgi:cysteine synthase A
MEEQGLHQRNPRKHFAEGFAGAVGETPLIRIASLSEATGCTILGKAEFMNPGGSVKDRPALYMLNAAEKNGQLKGGGWVVEATAGNTGIGLVHVANQRGYKCLFTCSASTSEEKIQLLQVLGAEVIRCPSVPMTDPDHFQNLGRRKAEELGGFFVNQFDNLNNWQAHYETTGPEIWRQTQHKVSGIVLAAGTGGTIAGTSRFLKEQNPNIQCFLMDLPGSGVTVDEEAAEDGGIKLREKTKEEKEASGTSVIEGVGASRLYENLRYAKLDGIFHSKEDTTAIEMAHYLLKKDGLFIGASSALNCVGAYLLARRLGPGHTIVTFLCDEGHRYITKIYNAEWLKQKNISIGPADDLSFLEAITTQNGLLSTRCYRE